MAARSSSSTWSRMASMACGCWNETTGCRSAARAAMVGEPPAAVTAASSSSASISSSGSCSVSPTSTVTAPRSSTPPSMSVATCRRSSARSPWLNTWRSSGMGTALRKSAITAACLSTTCCAAGKRSMYRLNTDVDVKWCARSTATASASRCAAMPLPLPLPLPLPPDVTIGTGPLPNASDASLMRGRRVGVAHGAVPLAPAPAPASNPVLTGTSTDPGTKVGAAARGVAVISWEGFAVAAASAARATACACVGEPRASMAARAGELGTCPSRRTPPLPLS
mmetsp:Transcript_28907/g.94101  ORF Transcript_28907/g.94101 Transcript_28907/m.94101 type:complete len:281 (-) Transcript_28907:2131-2973(-)